MAAWLGRDVAKFVRQPPEIKINPNGVDLKVSEVFMIDVESEAILHGDVRTVGKKLLAPDKDGFYNLERGVYDIRVANEVSIPQDAVGLCFPRSSLNRLGTIKSDGGVWDSGYKGFGTQTLFVPIKKLKIHKDEFWFQLMLFSNKDIADLRYEGHWQGKSRMANVSFVLIGIALFGTAIGAYTDVKTRLVPDWTNYFMLASGLGAYAIISVLQNTFWPILYSAAGLAAFFALGYVLYKSGAWGGGDAKMLAAYGAIFAPFPAIAAWPFVISLWLNIVLFGAVFGILGMFFILIKNKNKIFPELGKTLAEKKLMVYALSGTGLVSAVLTAYEIAFALILALALLAFLALIFKPTEKICLHKKIRPSQLVEGDWITHDVRVGNFLYEPKKSGIEKNDMEKLRQLEKTGQLDYVEVKDGLPYVPAFLAALVAALAYGDILYQMMIKFMGA